MVVGGGVIVGCDGGGVMRKLNYLPTQNNFAGFMTSKGRMVRYILYPKPFNFKFNTQWNKTRAVLCNCSHTTKGQMLLMLTFVALT